jgi:predicted ATPase/DNA-binding NarL/FixJ family response regulator
MVATEETILLLMAEVDPSLDPTVVDPPPSAAATEQLEALLATCLQRRPDARLIHGQGGQLVVGFSRPPDGVGFAVDLQLAVGAAAWPEGRPKLRIALHATERGADAVTEIGDYGRCASLNEVGHGGQTLLSRAARDLVINQLPAGAVLLDLGAVRLRDLSRPDKVYQLSHPGLQTEFPPLRSLDRVDNNLPVERTSFIGRQAERASIAKLVMGNRLVTLIGAGGCGKTRLALQVCADVALQYPDGVWWVDLARLADETLVPNAIADALAIKEASEQPLPETLVHHLGDRSVLLVLDNCEHLIEACGRLIHHLLDRCPALSLLTTSRERLDVEGEVPWRVPSLVLPGETDPAATLMGSEAAQLFAVRASAARPGYRVGDDAATVAAICHRLDGIPLAIELAAARMRILGAQQILDGLKDRFHLLTGGTRTALPRHQTLRASVDWSYRLLSDRERVALHRLAVFAGGFTLEAAESVCSDDDTGIVRREVLELIAGLVDRSLLQVIEGARMARYRLLETIRQYAADRLVESGEAEAVRVRHFRFYLALARRAERELEGSGLLEWLAVLDADHDNIRAALDWGARTRSGEDTLQLTSALWQFWMVRGHLSEGSRRFEAALAAEGLSPALRASALVGAGQLMINQGDLQATSRFAGEALGIARALGDHRLEGRALDTLGYASAFVDPAAAPRLFRQSAALSRETGDGVFLADGLNGLGISQFLAGDYLGAIAALEESVACSRERGNASTLTLGLGVLGYTLVLQGRLARARTCVRESLATARRLRDGAFTAQSLYTLGFIEAERGEHAAAEPFLAESVALAREASRLMLSFALLTHGLARYIAANLDGARLCLEEALALGGELGTPWVRAWSLALLGNLTRMRGDLPQARTFIEEALALAQTSNLRTDLPMDAAARLARATGDTQAAESLHHQALAAARGAQSVLLVPMQLEALASHAALAESFQEAARLFGAAQAAREAQGLVLHEVDRPQYEADVQRIRDGLSEGALRIAWDEGRAMSLDEASAYAARGRGERKRPAFGWDSLTPTELEVVRNVAQGLTNPDIARRLFVSRSTVKAHLAHIFAKLGVSTRAELAAQATRRGLTAAGGQK